MSTTQTAVVRCAVSWCAALATVGSHCPIHAKDATVHPQTLAPDEEAAEGSACEACDGSGDCEECSGIGQCSHECYSCGSGGHECGKCEGSGMCQTCNGEGKINYRKKATA